MMLYTNSDLGCFAKDPAVVELEGIWFLYHSIMEDGVLGIGIAISTDGEKFKRIAVLPRTFACEQKGVGAPAAIRLDGKIHLFYQTYGTGRLDAICHAVSEDGVSFRKDASNPIFAPREPFAKEPAWSCGRAIDADVCLFGDRLILYFATRDKSFTRQLVGAASAPLNSDFGRGSFDFYPEIVFQPELNWEKTCIEAPAALVHDGKVYLFYAGAYNCSPQQIGCAVSEDGFHFMRLFWEKPFLANGPAGSWNASESGHPYVYQSDDGKIWLYYQGSGDMGATWYLSRREVVFENGLPTLR